MAAAENWWIEFSYGGLPRPIQHSKWHHFKDNNGFASLNDRSLLVETQLFSWQVHTEMPTNHSCFFPLSLQDTCIHGIFLSHSFCERCCMIQQMLQLLFACKMQGFFQWEVYLLSRNDYLHSSSYVFSFGPKFCRFYSLKMIIDMAEILLFRLLCSELWKS